MKRVAFLAILLALVSAPAAHAQFSTPTGVNLSITPTDPRPYDTVTVTPESTDIDLSTASITVSANGSAIEKGGGVQSIPITLGGPGSATTIKVSAVAGGKTYTTSATLRPADVSLIVEPDSTTHAFYLGAPLVAAQGSVRIVAIADLRTSAANRLNPANLVYSWKFGDQQLAAQSGIGRSTLTAIAPVRYRDAQISVTVSDPTSGLIASAATVVSPVDPIARIYHSDALMGPDFNNALSGTYVMTTAEDAFRGVAYFFGTPPAFSWSVNGQSASSDKDVTVRTTGSGAGTANLSLTTASQQAGGQSVNAQLPIQFGAKSSTNIFGF